MNRLDAIRLRLARVEATPLLALAGLAGGLLVGLVIIAFRLLIEAMQAGMPSGDGTGSHEALAAHWRFTLPALGGLALGIAFQWLPHSARQVSVVHVMERLAYHEGHLPWRNAVVQFLGAATSIACGHSVGREGPAVHLGAATSSLLGQWLALPNNSIRTLVACGVAAAIAASFNTPLAGVIFAMEVVMMEYTIAGFAPVILAAVSATVLTRAVFGSAPAFAVPAMELASLWELPWLVAIGLVVGTLSAAFIVLMRHTTRASADMPVWARLTLAGVVTGVLALAVPQVMGIGYDTVEASLLGGLGANMLIAIMLARLAATAIGIGLGLPGGLIGPTLVIGAACGGALGMVPVMLFEHTSPPGLYAMLGMGAMMAATLHAPLAALVALLELTSNPNIILPGMLTVISAYLVTRDLFGEPSVFLSIMRERGMDYRNDPVAQSLRRQGVTAVMDRNLRRADRVSDRETLKEMLGNSPRWLVFDDSGGRRILLPAGDLLRFMASRPDKDPIDLKEVPAQRLELAPIHPQATLQEALDTLNGSDAGALYVSRATVPGIERIDGIVTRQDIEASY